jgi:hypothetical protein
MERITKAKELIKTKQLLYEKKFVEFCLANPGYVMHNDGTRSMVCSKLLKMVEHCNYVHEIIQIIEAQKLWSEQKAIEQEGKMHGHRQSIGVFEELLQLIKPLNFI